MYHIPVLLQEVLAYLPKKNSKPSIIIDATFGGGGYSEAILKKYLSSDEIFVLAFELDPKAYKRGRQGLLKKYKNFLITNTNFKNIDQYEALFPEGIHQRPVCAIIFDLGFSSYQLQGDEAIGISFEEDQRLSMRYDRAENKLTAADVLNTYSRDDLQKIFTDFVCCPISVIEHPYLVNKFISRHWVIRIFLSFDTFYSFGNFYLWLFLKIKSENYFQSIIILRVCICHMKRK